LVLVLKRKVGAMDQVVRDLGSLLLVVLVERMETMEEAEKMRLQMIRGQSFGLGADERQRVVSKSLPVFSQCRSRSWTWLGAPLRASRPGETKKRRRKRRRKEDPDAVCRGS